MHKGINAFGIRYECIRHKCKSECLNELVRGGVSDSACVYTKTVHKAEMCIRLKCIYKSQTKVLVRAGSLVRWVVSACTYT